MIYIWKVLEDNNITPSKFLKSENKVPKNEINVPETNPANQINDVQIRSNIEFKQSKKHGEISHYFKPILQENKDETCNKMELNSCKEENILNCPLQNKKPRVKELRLKIEQTMHI